MFNLKLKIMIRKILVIDDDNVMFVFDSGNHFMDYYQNFEISIKSVHVVEVEESTIYSFTKLTIL